MPKNTQRSDLAAEARRHDPDRWLCTLFVAEPGRDAAMALLLLNHELARIPDLVSQPLTGMIRYQWWRDALEEAAAGRPRAHPVIEALAKPIARARLDLGELLAMIDAREHDLDHVAPEDMTVLEGYLEATAGAVQVSTARLLDADPAEITAARAVGTAFGLIGIVRAAALMARQDRAMLPRSLVEAAGVEPDRAWPERSREALRPAIRSICERAMAILDESRRAPWRRGRAAALPGVLARDYALRIARADFDPQVAAGLRRAPTMPIRLWWAFQFGAI
jgi:phytoene synthase